MITLIKPKNNAKLNIYRKNVKKYIEDMEKQNKNIINPYTFDCLVNDNVNIDNYLSFPPNEKYPNKDNRPLPITLTFNSSSKINTILLWAENDKKKTEYIVEKNNLKVYNLIPNIKYFWQVKNESESSEIYSFTVTSRIRLIKGYLGFNYRDLGGAKTMSGKTIKYGLAFRGVELVYTPYTFDKCEHCRLTSKKDIKTLQDLGIKQELDLRGDGESNFMVQSILNDENHKIDYKRIPINAYRAFFTDVTNESTLTKYSEIIDMLSNADKKPIYFHCWGGADRTGTIGLLLYGILGTSLTDILIDYELTSFNGNYRNHKIDDRERTWATPLTMFNYLKSYAKENETIQDTIIRFLVSDAKIDIEKIKKIQNIFLQ